MTEVATCDERGCTLQSIASMVYSAPGREGVIDEPDVSTAAGLQSLRTRENAAMREAVEDELWRFGSEMVAVTVELREVGFFDFASLKWLGTEARASTIAERKQRVEVEVERQLAESLSAVGFSDVSPVIEGYSWLTHAVDVRVGADVARALLDAPDVVGVYLDGGGGEDSPDFEELWEQSEASTWGAAPATQGWGYTGNLVDPNERIKMGIIEWGSGIPNTDHVSFDFRIRSVQFCKLYGTVRKCDDYSGGPVGTHETGVTGMAAQDLLDGQDSAFTSATSRRQRSAFAGESDIHFYAIGATYPGQNAREAIEHAVENDVDIVNMSWHANDTPTCNPSLNMGGLNGAISSAAAAGMVLVAAAGNQGDGSSCNVNYPAIRRDVISVSGLETSSVDYDLAVIDSDSSRGDYDIELYGGATVSTPMVNIAGPYHVDEVAKFDVNSGSAGYTGYLGTSFSSPFIASYAAMVREWMSEIGSSRADDSLGVMATLLLAGDGGHTTTRWFRTVSDLMGFGRIKAFAAASSSAGNIGSLGKYQITRAVISDGETLEVYAHGGTPLPVGYDWKMVLLVEQAGWDDLPDLAVKVWKEDCLFGLSDLHIETATKHAGMARVRLESPDALFCYRMEITGNEVNGSEVIWIADVSYVP